MSVEPSEESQSITLGRRLSLSLLHSDNQIRRDTSAQSREATLRSGPVWRYLFFNGVFLFSDTFFISRTLFEQQCVFLCVWVRAMRGSGASQWRYCWTKGERSTRWPLFSILWRVIPLEHRKTDPSNQRSSTPINNHTYRACTPPQPPPPPPPLLVHAGLC